MKTFNTFVLFLAAILFFQSQVGIGTNSPNDKAILDLESSSKGLLLPRLTSAEITALGTTLPEGLMVYNKFTHEFVGWNGSYWQILGNFDNTPSFGTVDFMGTLKVGELLTATTSGYTDSENDMAGTPLYFWYYADDNAGTNETLLASTQNYTLTASEVSKYIKFCTQATATSGASPGNIQCTLYQGPVMPLVTATPFNVGWDFNGNTGSEVTVNGVSDNTNVTNAVVSRGNGITASGNADRFNATNFTQPDIASAITNNDYFQFTITVASGSMVDLASIAFNYEKSGTGPSDGVLRSSVDSYASNIQTFSGMANGSSHSVDVSANTAYDALTGTITFRLYLFGNSNTAGSGGFEGTGNDLTITGTIY